MIRGPHHQGHGKGDRGGQRLESSGGVIKWIE